MRQLLFLVAAVLLLVPFAHHGAGEETAAGGMDKGVAVLYPVKGSTTSGVVTFTKESDGIRVVANLQGLSEGRHGFHIHEYGDCRSPDAGSAGGHFNPTGKQHGAPADTNRHVGDLGNVVANTEGKAHYEWTDKVLSFAGPASIIGRSVIVHADPDDLRSQPAGNAGARIACGVIGVEKK